jgi:hypothetical protein
MVIGDWQRISGHATLDSRELVSLLPQRRGRRFGQVARLGQDLEPEGHFVGLFNRVSQLVDEVRARARPTSAAIGSRRARRRVGQLPGDLPVDVIDRNALAEPNRVDRELLGAGPQQIRRHARTEA